MLKKALVLSVLMIAACSKGPSVQDQRIAALEQENAQLREQLKQAKDNVAALHSAMGHSSASDDATDERPGAPAAPTAISPAPQNSIGQSAADKAGDGIN